MADNELSTELYVMQYHIFTRIQRQIESMVLQRFLEPDAKRLRINYLAF